MLQRVLLTLVLGSALFAASGCAKCGPSNCTGCCDANGACQAASPDHCGQNGTACAACAPFQICLVGACTFPGGNSGGSGNGSGSTTTTTATHGSTTSSTSSSTSSGTTGSGGSTGGVSSGGVSSGGTSATTATTATTGTTATTATTGTTGTSAGTRPTCAPCTENGQCLSGICDTQNGWCSQNSFCSSASDCGGHTCDSSGMCQCSNVTTGTTTGTVGTSGTTSTTATTGTTTGTTGTTATTGTSAGTTTGTTGTTGVAGDICATALTLNNNATVNGDTTNATNNYDTSQGNTCTNYSASANDLVYRFSPSASGAYTFTLTPTNSSYDPAIYIVNTCPTAPLSTCVAGADVGGAGQTETLSVTLSAGSSYYVIVDGYRTGDNGPFNLLVANGSTTGTTGTTGSAATCVGCNSDTQCASGYCDPNSGTCQPANGCASDADCSPYTCDATVSGLCLCGSTPDAGGSTGGNGSDNCTSPPVLNVTGPGQSDSASGDTTGMTSQGTTSACGGSGPDVFYAFTLTQGASVSVTLNPTSGTYQPVLSISDLASGCPATLPATYGCNRASAVGGSATLSVSLNAGSYLLVADTYSSNVGPFHLDISAQ